MGLDANFYRRFKSKEIPDVTSEQLLNLFNGNDKIKDLYNRLNKYADNEGYSFEEVLEKALQEFLDRNEYDNSTELAYFRKFHFLNDYFNYTDENYAKDLTVTKEQCKYLHEKADTCLKECNKVVMDFEDKSQQICNKFFPCDCKDATYKKVSTIYITMKDILEYTDWDNEYIVYRADW